MRTIAAAPLDNTVHVVIVLWRTVVSWFSDKINRRRNLVR